MTNPHIGEAISPRQDRAPPSGLPARGTPDPDVNRRCEIREWSLAGGSATFRRHRLIAEGSLTLTQQSDRHRLFLPANPFRARAARPGQAAGLRFIPAGSAATISLSSQASAVMEVSFDRHFARTTASIDDCVVWRAGTAAGIRKVTACTEALIAATTTHPAADPVTAVLLASLTRTIAAQLGAGPERPDDGWLHPVALRRLIEAIEDHLDCPMPAPEMASVTGLGVSAFHRAFRGSTGRTPLDYLLERQVARAHELLTGGAADIEEVARRCGFSNSARFSAVLRERTGTTPARLQRLRSAKPLP